MQRLKVFESANRTHPMPSLTGRRLAPASASTDGRSILPTMSCGAWWWDWLSCSRPCLALAIQTA